MANDYAWYPAHVAAWNRLVAGLDQVMNRHPAEKQLAERIGRALVEHG